MYEQASFFWSDAAGRGWRRRFWGMLRPRKEQAVSEQEGAASPGLRSEERATREGGQ
jgi:hypothetical protein